MNASTLLPYRHNNRSVGISLWHFEWATKYRRDVFGRADLRRRIEALIRQCAERHSIEIIELAVQPEHVHAIVELPLTLAPADALQRLKGGSSFMFFKERPEMRECMGGSLWSAGKFATSLGRGDLEPTREYVRRQDEHHAIERNAA